MTDRLASYRRFVVGDFQIGADSTHIFTITPEDLAMFSAVSGDRHPLHCDRELAKARQYADVLVHGMLVASRSSAFVAHDFIGTYGLLLSMSADFRQPVWCGEDLIWKASVSRVVPEDGILEILWQITNASGVVVQRGTACAWLPNR